MNCQCVRQLKLNLEAKGASLPGIEDVVVHPESQQPEVGIFIVIKKTEKKKAGKGRRKREEETINYLKARFCPICGKATSSTAEETKKKWTDRIMSGLTRIIWPFGSGGGSSKSTTSNASTSQRPPQPMPIPKNLSSLTKKDLPQSKPPKNTPSGE